MISGRTSAMRSASAGGSGAPAIIARDGSSSSVSAPRNGATAAARPSQVSECAWAPPPSSERSRSTNGWKRRLRPSATERPSAQRTARPSTLAASSVSKRDLPSPASPTTPGDAALPDREPREHVPQRRELARRARRAPRRSSRPVRDACGRPAPAPSAGPTAGPTLFFAPRSAPARTRSRPGSRDASRARPTHGPRARRPSAWRRC